MAPSAPEGHAALAGRPTVAVGVADRMGATLWLPLPAETSEAHRAARAEVEKSRKHLVVHA